MDSHSGSIVSSSTARSVPFLEKGEERRVRDEKENISKGPGIQHWNSTLRQEEQEFKVILCSIVS